MGVTDVDWISHLRSVSDFLPDANFWNPGGVTRFAALAPGELFLLKTKKAHGNKIVGAATFDGFVFAEAREAWELFGEANGVRSLDELLERIGRLRVGHVRVPPETQIGCTLLRDVQFFGNESIEAPDDFHLNSVRGQRYVLDGLPLEHPIVRASSLYTFPGLTPPAGPIPEEVVARMFGDARLVTPRLGQQAFKAVIAANYRHRCAVTGEKVRPVLEAAHIRPVADGGQHRTDNGLLLRSDMHTLFDRGYIGVDERHRLQVSPRLRTEFGNGDALYAAQGTTIALPNQKRDHPAGEFLTWHMDTIFKSAAF